LLGAIYALFSSGLTLIWGMMNFINFAHGEFVMLGMYVAFLVVVWLHGGPAVFTLAAAFALLVLGIAIYLSLIRHVIRGPMLAQILSTFGLALLLRYTAFYIFSANFVSLPQTWLAGTVNFAGVYLPVAQLVGGVIAIALTVALHILLTHSTIGIGLQGPAIARGWWDLTFRSELPYYYLFLAVLVTLLAVTTFIERRRFGFYLCAIKASERAARSLGVPVRRTKMQALVLSAAFTSVAGSLYVIKTGFIDPDSGFGILISVQMVIIAALGGAGTLFGPLVGALILIPL
jgi:branched-subunit amino acid ABC-type transport system permease component